MFKKIAFAATLAILASSAFAAEKPSFYAGADIGSTKIDGISDRQTSFGGFIGYQFHENFAVEGGYRRLADFDVIKGANLTLDQAAVSVIGTLPLSSGFNVFGRLGYNRVEATGNAGSFSSTASDTGVLYGVGLGYAFNAKISARVEVQKPSSDSSNVSVGVSYKF
jgi:OOP family OmpA-OmpF porin